MRQHEEVFDIDEPDEKSLTPLMKASINGHLEVRSYRQLISVQIVKLLLRFGANPRIKNNRGESALALACMQEQAGVVERLIYAKADVNEMDHQRKTPLLKAARHNSKVDII